MLKKTTHQYFKTLFFLPYKNNANLKLRKQRLPQDFLQVFVQSCCRLCWAPCAAAGPASHTWVTCGPVVTWTYRKSPVSKENFHSWSPACCFPITVPRAVYSPFSSYQSFWSQGDLRIYFVAEMSLPIGTRSTRNQNSPACSAGVNSAEVGVDFVQEWSWQIWHCSQLHPDMGLGAWGQVTKSSAKPGVSPVWWHLGLWGQNPPAVTTGLAQGHPPEKLWCPPTSLWCPSPLWCSSPFWYPPTSLWCPSPLWCPPISPLMSTSPVGHSLPLWPAPPLFRDVEHRKALKVPRELRGG